MDEELVKNQIEQIALEYPRYGYRRITEELKRRDFIVNHKRVLKLMQEEDLLCKHKKKFMVTTDSNHPLPIYPNLIKGMIVTRINQIWVADITYIPLTTGKFVFLAVVLDLYSRKVVGWHLGSDLSSILVCHALQMAILSRKPPAGLIHALAKGQVPAHRYP